jgi:ribose transport system permease protein
MRYVRTYAPLVAAMIILLLLFRVWVPNLLTPRNIVDLMQQISVNAILAFGMTLVILIGGIDLSVGAVLALVGTTTVYLLGQGALGTNPWMGVLAVAGGFGVAAIVGTVNGMLSAKTLIPPFIVTLSTMLMARGWALSYNEGRPMPIPDDHWLLQVGNGKLGTPWLPIPVLLMLAVFLITAVLLHLTTFGRRLYGLGGNKEAARLSGMPVVRDTVVVYVLCGLLAGLAGTIHTSQLYAAEPSSGVGFELNAIAAVVVGGTSFSGGVGTMPGTLLGAIVIGILDKGLNQAGVHFSLQYVVKGAVILGAVLLDVVRRKR